MKLPMKRMYRIASTATCNAMLVVFAVFAFSVAATAAETPEEKGLAIAKEAEMRDTGWQDSTADMKMLLKNKEGKESLREMRLRILEVISDGDKSLIIFDKPKDVKGTKLLTFSHKTGTDDQWLFLPALKRVKRIASRSKSGPFIGSEFAYEDMVPPEIEKYTYKYLRDETIEGLDSFIVERYPVDKNSGYSRQVVWIDKAEYRVLKIDFHDRKESHLKTLTTSGYKKYLDKFWRPDKYLMINHQTGKSTILSYSDYKFSTGLSDGDFNKSRLKSIR